MTRPTSPPTGLTLEEFLALPGQGPAWEFIEGRPVRRANVPNRYGRLLVRLASSLGAFAGPRGLGSAFVGLRRTFGGQSIVPDVVFLRREHVPFDERGRIRDEPFQAPDLHVEILSPQEARDAMRWKLRHSLAHGCGLGWLIDPEARVVEVYRADAPVQQLGRGSVLEGEPVLPGLRLPVAELFDWLEE